MNGGRPDRCPEGEEDGQRQDGDEESSRPCHGVEVSRFAPAVASAVL
jgi:hypothetical protein